MEICLEALTLLVFFFNYEEKNSKWRPNVLLTVNCCTKFLVCRVFRLQYERRKEFYSSQSTYFTKLSIMSLKQEMGCKAIDENTGKKCGESESLRILDKFQDLYKARLEEVNQRMENEVDRLEVKLRLFTFLSRLNKFF